MSDLDKPEQMLDQFLTEEATQLDATDPLAANINRGYVSFMQSSYGNEFIQSLREEKLQSQPYTLGHNSRHLRYLFHEQLMAEYPSLREEQFPSAQGCADFIEDISRDGPRSDTFRDHHQMFDPRTPKPERYYGLLLASVVFTERDKGLEIVDFGCCNNTGSALIDIFTHTESDVILGDMLPPLPFVEGGGYHGQQALQSLFRLTKETPLERAVGIDIFHPNDPFVRKYTAACAPTKRLFDPKYKAMLSVLQLHAFNRRADERITFTPHDTNVPAFYETPAYSGGKYILSDGSVHPYEIDQLPTDWQADLAFSSLSIYMKNPEQRRIHIDNMLALGRVAVVFDAIRTVDKRRKKHIADQLVISEKWDPHDFRLVACSPDLTNGEWVQLATSREGDFRSIAISPVVQNMLREAA